MISLKMVAPCWRVDGKIVERTNSMFDLSKMVAPCWHLHKNMPNYARVAKTWEATKNIVRV